MKTKKTWKTPMLAPLSGESTDGSVIPIGMWAGAMASGEAKTNAGGSETRATSRMGGMTYYSHTGPS